MSEPSEPVSSHSVRYIGLVSGVVCFAAVLLLPAPAGLPEGAQRVAAITLLMAIWWVTEAVPLAAASLVPLALYPLLNVMSAKSVAVCYGDSTVFLFAGGFFIAMAMQKWRLHERLALQIIRKSGTNARTLVLGFMVATAFISLWISNAATTMMMLPIGLAVIEQFERDHPAPWVPAFGTCVMLGIAYASSIGGVGTIVGTAPNVIFVGQMANLFPEAPRISFGQWLLFGIPLVVIFVPIAWFVLTRVAYPLPASRGESAQGRKVIEDKLAQLGPMSRGERVVSVVFALTVLAWVFRANIPLGAVTIPGWASLFPNPDWIEDGTVAIIFALLLFMIPVDLRKGEFALDWEWARRIPWGVLLLFGGGFAIAKGFNDTKLVDWAGERMGAIDGMHPLLTIALLAVAVTFLTEFMSNTALTNLMIPILALSATSALHVNPLFILIPAVLSASLGFMMPAGTPPNALVFGSGYVTTAQMMRAGFWLNLIGIALVTLISYYVAAPVFGIDLERMPDWAQ